MSKLSQKFYLQPSLVVARRLLGKYLVRDDGGQRLAGKIVETEAYCGFGDKASHAARGLTERNSVMFEKGGYWYVYVIYGIFNCLNIVTEKKGFPSAVLIRALEPVEGIDEMGKNRRIRKCYSYFSLCPVRSPLYPARVNGNPVCHPEPVSDGRRISRECENYLSNKLRDSSLPLGMTQEDRIIEEKSLKSFCSGPGKLCQAMKIDRELNKTKAFGKGCQLWIENGENVRPSRIAVSPRIGVDYAGVWAKKKWRFYIKDNQFVSRQ